MLRIKVRNYEGELIMLLQQTVEHRGFDEEIYLYKVIIKLKENEEITLERVRLKEILIYGRDK